MNYSVVGILLGHNIKAILLSSYFVINCFSFNVCAINFAVEAKLPVVLTTLSGMNNPRYMNCNDIVDSMNKEVTVWTFDDLGIDESKVGLAGSPTKVHIAWRPAMIRS